MKNNAIKPEIIQQYVAAMSQIRIPMEQLKRQLRENLSHFKEVGKAQERVMELLGKSKESQLEIMKNLVLQIAQANNGVVPTRLIEPLGISRHYLALMEEGRMLEKVSRGLYLLPEAYEDSYFVFQQKHKKAIFSHMHALYFYHLTEELPYTYTVTIPQNYHSKEMNAKCNVFYVSPELYELGITEILTPNGNTVYAYDRERCICDIVRSRKRLDLEQVKKSLKMYMSSHEKDLVKLSEYAKKLKVSESVMGALNGIYYD